MKIFRLKIKNMKNELLKMVAEYHFSEVLETLLNDLLIDEKADIELLSERWKVLREQVRKESITETDTKGERNKIAAELKTFIQKMPDEIPIVEIANLDSTPENRIESDTIKLSQEITPPQYKQVLKGIFDLRTHLFV